MKSKRRLEGGHEQANAGEDQAGSDGELAGVPQIVGIGKEAEDACHGEAGANYDECFRCHPTVAAA